MAKMNLKLLNKYDVKFSKRTGSNGGIHCVTRGSGVAEFLDGWNDPDSIKEGIDNVEYYLKGGASDYEHNTVSSEIYTAWLDHTTADIYPNVGNTELLLQSVPLEDFKSILEEWLAFVNISTPIISSYFLYVKTKLSNMW